MKIGIVGAGAMGANHLRVVHSLPGVSLAAAADIDADKRRFVTDSYGVPAFADYRELASGVDAVMVSTPTRLHHEMAKFFLERGRHVLVEKPITVTLAEADELVELAERKGLCLAVGHVERFNPAVAAIAPLVTSPRFIESQRLGSFSPRSLDIDVILDLMIHDLDIILRWDRSGVKEIRAVGIPVISTKTDIASVRLEFYSGLVANVTASRISQQKIRKLRIFQPHQYISLDYRERSVKIISLEEGQIREQIPQVEDGEPLARMWSGFLGAAARGAGERVSGEEARQALELALQISTVIRRNREP